MNFSSFPDLVDISTSTAIILCSSGTTGLPKGVCKSYSEVISQFYPIWDLKSTKQEVLFGFSTIFWGTGALSLIIGALYGAKRVITTKPFSADLLADVIDRYQVTTYMSAPYAIALLLQKKDLKPFPSLEFFIAVGSVVSKSLCEGLKPFLPNGEICTLYAMSEGSLLADSFRSLRYGSVGQLSPNVDMRIIDDAGSDLGPNCHGEICFKSLVTFLGYFGEPEKTAETVKNGWVHTGDIGYFDDDGFLFIVDRKKDMLKVDNFQVCLKIINFKMRDSNMVSFLGISIGARRHHQRHRWRLQFLCSWNLRGRQGK